MLALRTALGECCRVFSELPSAATSIIGGDGICCYSRRPGTANVITVRARLCDGTHATYIRADDIQLTAFDAEHKPVHVQVQLNMGGTVIIARYGTK